jgi:hypothetical protein
MNTATMMTSIFFPAQVTPGTVYIEIKQTQKAKLIEGKQAHL